MGKESCRISCQLLGAGLKVRQMKAETVTYKNGTRMRQWFNHSSGTGDRVSPPSAPMVQVRRCPLPYPFSCLNFDCSHNETAKRSPCARRPEAHAPGSLLHHIQFNGQVFAFNGHQVRKSSSTTLAVVDGFDKATTMPGSRNRTKYYYFGFNQAL